MLAYVAITVPTSAGPSTPPFEGRNWRRVGKSYSLGQCYTAAANLHCAKGLGSVMRLRCVVIPYSAAGRPRGVAPYQSEPPTLSHPANQCVPNDTLLSSIWSQPCGVARRSGWAALAVARGALGRRQAQGGAGEGPGANPGRGSTGAGGFTAGRTDFPNARIPCNISSFRPLSISICPHNPRVHAMTPPGPSDSPGFAAHMVVVD